MSSINIIRAWKDPKYRISLTAAEQAALPAHPAGAIELDDGVLNQIVGGRPRHDTTMKCYSARTQIQGCTCP